MRSAYAFPSSFLLGHCGWLHPSAEGPAPVGGPFPAEVLLRILTFSGLGAMMAPMYPSLRNNDLIFIGFLIYWLHTCK